MNRNSFDLGALMLLLAVSTFAQADETAQPGRQQAMQLNASVPVTMNYLLALPEDYEQQERWPLVLFLHGAGERGENLDLVQKHGPPMLVKDGKTFPFILVSPQCPAGRWWEPVSLLALIDDIVKNYHVDEDRVYVTGLSMGGFGTWALAAHAPERLAAIAPICGGGEPYWADRLKSVPTWIFHGALDQAVPLIRSEVMADAVKKKGGAVKLTIYPEVGHNSWTEAYNNPELYEWLLSQRRRTDPNDSN